MRSKPVTPTQHGIIDYIFSAILVAGPTIAKLNNSAAKTYGTAGTAFLLGNTFTDTPVGLQPALSFKDHQKTDTVFLVGLAALSFVNFVRKDRKVLPLHLGFLATAIAHYILTDYNAAPEPKAVVQDQADDFIS